MGERVGTTLPAGKMVPIAYTHLLREDALKHGRISVKLEMNETAEILMNAVYAVLNVYFVPFLAMERFNKSLDLFNRSYKGLALGEDDVVAFIETHSKAANAAVEPIYKYAGLHGKTGAAMNTIFAESYNQLWNLRATNRSPSIARRAVTLKTLAPAFWRHENFAHIVPDFDEGAMEGEVALSVANARLPVTGIAKFNDTFPSTAQANLRESDGSLKTYPKSAFVDGGTNDNTFYVRENADEPGFPDIFAELQDNGITVSLANIELAKKTQAFARIREQFTGHDDDYIIDMLMDGQSIPDQQLKQPMLIASAVNVFGATKRYSTDADALQASAVNGFTELQAAFRVPRTSTGGIIMAVLEITPEQMFERKKDWFMHQTSVANWPEYLRDELDPQKVVIVKNDWVDVDHDTPNGTFGYAPLNHEQVGTVYRLGGDFYRPAVDAEFDEDRQAFWAVEVENPVLSEDFYICTTMHQKPFLDTEKDPFRATIATEYVIEGNTVFGPPLVEMGGNYDAVMAKAPTARIEKD